MTDAYRISPDWSDDHIQKNRDGSLVTPGWYWCGGLAFKICPEKGLELARRQLPKMKKLGLEGVYLCDAMPVGIYNCFDPNHAHGPFRREVAEGYRKIAALTQKVFGGCHCENYQDYMAGVTDAISCIPSRGALPPKSQPRLRAFHECFLNAFVPFYQIVYHGIIQYHMSPADVHRDEFLNEIEYGAMPRNQDGIFDRPVKTAPVAMLKKTLHVMKKQYAVLCEELGHLQFEFIENHRKIAPGVLETTYSDGTRVLVNYRERTFVGEGVKIPARGYRHIRPGRGRRGGVHAAEKRDACSVGSHTRADRSAKESRNAGQS